jgi:hypothetical protein
MRFVCTLACVAGLAVSAHAHTEFKYQVSPAGAETWFSSLDVLPGTAVDIRAVVSYRGVQPVLGLGSVAFQPVISNWTTGPGGDTLAPFINSGSNTSTPSGVVPDGPGAYGRISPWGRTFISTTAAYRGFVGTPGGVTSLRIGLANFTSWIGEGNNTTGIAGVLTAQLSNIGRTASDPAFNPQITDIVVFKFKIELGDTNLRTLTVDTPTAGFGNLNTTTGQRNGHWFGSLSEAVGSIREEAIAVPALINVVPTPAAVALLGIALAMPRRRR